MISTNSRLDNWDLLCVWFFAYVLVLVLSWSLKYSFVASIFAVVNFYILFQYFSLPPNDEVQVRNFINGLRAGAHRGLALDAPENTIGAFKQAKTLGADFVEFDLEFTSDDVPVLLHDDTVDRTTDGKGDISEMTWEEVQKLNAAAKFKNKEKFPMERIPHLENALKVCLELNLKILIDVKRCHKKVAETLADLFRKHEALYGNAAVCSFYPNVIWEVKKMDPRIMVGHTWMLGFLPYEVSEMTKPRLAFPTVALASALDRLYIWFLHNWLWKLTGATLILTHHPLISQQYIADWKNKGVQVVAWTVNDIHEKIYYLQGVELPFLTDKLSDMQNLLPVPHREISDTWSIPGSEESGLDMGGSAAAGQKGAQEES